MGAAFVTISELEALTGVTYTGDSLTRVETMLPLVSDLIRTEGNKYGVDVDTRVTADAAYESVVKLITCDVTTRAMRQSMTGDPIS
jgi:hypothetical protein